MRLGIPVRVTRNNPDSGTMYGHVFVYDGLYDVVWSLCFLMSSAIQGRN